MAARSTCCFSSSVLGIWEPWDNTTCRVQVSQVSHSVLHTTPCQAVCSYLSQNSMGCYTVSQRTMKVRQLEEYVLPVCTTFPWVRPVWGNPPWRPAGRLQRNPDAQEKFASFLYVLETKWIANVYCSARNICRCKGKMFFHSVISNNWFLRDQWPEQGLPLPSTSVNVSGLGPAGG